MSNFSAAFGFARICPNFGSPWFGKHFAVLQSWTKLLKKTKHEQNKNHFLTSPSHPLPLCNDNRTQRAKNHSLTVSPFIILPQLLLPPPSPLCNVDVGSDACQETVRDPKDNIESGGGGGRGIW